MHSGWPWVYPPYTFHHFRPCIYYTNYFCLYVFFFLNWISFHKKRGLVLLNTRLIYENYLVVLLKYFYFPIFQAFLQEYYFRIELSLYDTKQCASRISSRRDPSFSFQYGTIPYFKGRLATLVHLWVYVCMCMFMNCMCMNCNSSVNVWRKT